MRRFVNLRDFAGLRRFVNLRDAAVLRRFVNLRDFAGLRRFVRRRNPNGAEEPPAERQRLPFILRPLTAQLEVDRLRERFRRRFLNLACFPCFPRPFKFSNFPRLSGSSRFVLLQRVPNRFERGAVPTVNQRKAVFDPSVRRRGRRDSAVLRRLRRLRRRRRLPDSPDSPDLPNFAVLRFRRVSPDRSDENDRRRRRRSSDAFPKISIDFHRQIEYH